VFVERKTNELDNSLLNYTPPLLCSCYGIEILYLILILDLHIMLVTHKSMRHLSSALTIISLFILLFAMSACSNQGQLTPEQQVEKVIDAMESAIENRNNSQFMEHISDDYLDHTANTKKSIRKIATAYLLQNKNINLIIQLDSVDLINQSTAAIEATILMTGTKANLTGRLPFLRFDNQKVSGVFRLTGDDWLLSSISWETQRRR